MADLKICRICLHTEVKVYHYYQYQLKSYYEDILALTLDDMDNLPQYFCVQCAILLHKYHKFKEKCCFGQNIFQEMQQKGPITYDAMKTIDRSNLDLLCKSQVDKIIDIIHGIDESLPIDIIIKEEDKDNDKTEKNAVMFENKDVDIEMDIPSEDAHDYEDNIVITEEPGRPVSKKNKKVKNKIKGKRKDSKCIDKDVNEKKDVNEEKDESNQKEKVIKRLILMDDSKWLKFDLSEEDAIQEFRLKALDEKYTGAAYKCADCFKGFSEEDMLKRHIKIRHSESQGSIECQFCKMRFKRKCRLRQHIREHYNKFKCLRCNFICVLESTALSHELYHNGVTRKCEYCGKEFRYSSTYYTHLRTHRSQYVCTLCGSSFVSEAGLHQHKRIKHCTKEKKVQEKDKEVNKFCSKCDIQFETRKAFEEHLYHSTMHADENGADIPKPINILEKSIQNKVTSLFKSRKIDSTLKSEKRGKKPTTCHQCDKHFSSQAACLKHHLQEHPGTSSCPPNLRHICEICGASLAPGSVAVHKNMHTREKVFACSTCGRQFYESVGLKRHLLKVCLVYCRSDIVITRCVNADLTKTHTGEKPFQCSSCDKRFTQSASLKLHFKTFHLKEPYPKRIRRKKE